MADLKTITMKVIGDAVAGPVFGKNMRQAFDSASLGNVARATYGMDVDAQRSYGPKRQSANSPFDRSQKNGRNQTPFPDQAKAADNRAAEMQVLGGILSEVTAIRGISTQIARTQLQSNVKLDKISDLLGTLKYAIDEQTERLGRNQDAFSPDTSGPSGSSGGGSDPSKHKGLFSGIGDVLKKVFEGMFLEEAVRRGMKRVPARASAAGETAEARRAYNEAEEAKLSEAGYEKRGNGYVNKDGKFVPRSEIDRAAGYKGPTQTAEQLAEAAKPVRRAYNDAEIARLQEAGYKQAGRGVLGPNGKFVTMAEADAAAGYAAEDAAKVSSVAAKAEPLLGVAGGRLLGAAGKVFGKVAVPLGGVLAAGTTWNKTHSLAQAGGAGVGAMGGAIAGTEAGAALGTMILPGVGTIVGGIGGGILGGMGGEGIGKWVGKGIDHLLGKGDKNTGTMNVTAGTVNINPVIKGGAGPAPGVAPAGASPVSPGAAPNIPKGDSNNGKGLMATAMAMGIKGKEELAAFMSQMHLESGGFKRLEENLKYSAGSLMKNFGSHFKGGFAEATKYVTMGEKAIANKIYSNRMGNGDESSGDGWKYRGRGYVQLTGKDNYKAAGKALGLDLVNNPDLAATPDIAGRIAVWYWQKRVAPKVNDFTNTALVSKLINGGTIGLAARTALFAKYMAEGGPHSMENANRALMGLPAVPAKGVTPPRGGLAHHHDKKPIVNVVHANQHHTHNNVVAAAAGSKGSSIPNPDPPMQLYMLFT